MYITLKYRPVHFSENSCTREEGGGALIAPTHNSVGILEVKEKRANCLFIILQETSESVQTQ